MRAHYSRYHPDSNDSAALFQIRIADYAMVERYGKQALRVAKGIAAQSLTEFNAKCLPEGSGDRKDHTDQRLPRSICGLDASSSGGR